MACGLNAKNVQLNRLGSGLRSLLVVCLLVALVTPLAAAQRLTLMWDPSEDPSVTGYKVYYEEVGSGITNVVDAGESNTVTLTNLAPTLTYRFYVSAYNAEGLESDPSNVLQLTIPLRLATTTISRGAQGQSVLGFSVPAVTGRQVALQRSTDLLTWTTCLTAAAGSPLSCQVTNNPGQVRQFYRAICLP
jgi:hypothetical protein